MLSQLSYDYSVSAGVLFGCEVERCVALENMPQCDQEELYAVFGTAINILDFTCDETISE